MTALFLVGVSTVYWAEARGNSQLSGVNQAATALQSGGNMEGKKSALESPTPLSSQRRQPMQAVGR